MKKKVKKRFFAILLLLAIVFTNVGTDFFYVQAGSIEANESVQEENTETITDTETVEIGTDSVSDTEEVSESTETVEDTEKVDESTETVADTEVIDTEEDIPEEAAPEEEQIPDQEYTWRDTTAERNLYYDDWSKENMGRIYLGETLEELFQMYEDPTLEMAGWEDFFAGTCFAGATLEELKWMQESGYTMDQLIQIASDNNRSNVWQMLSGIALMASYQDKTVAFGGNTKTGHIPAFGKKNAPVYSMTMGGKKAFCADCGKHMSSSTVLSYVSEVNTSYIKKAMAYADNGGYYDFSQFYIWAGGNKENYCKGYAQFNYSMMHQDLSYDQIAALTTDNTRFAALYKEAERSYESITNTSTSGVHVYMYSNGNSAYQRIYAMVRKETPETPDPTPPDPTPSNDPLYADVSADAEAYVDANVSLNVVKKDNVTGQGLAGAVFNFFLDGGYEGSGTTDGNGNVSFSFTTSYYGAASSSKTYCTNYGSLTDDKKATVSTYTSYDAAYNAAYNEAYTKALNAANAAKNSTSHNYSATEVTARNGYYLNPGNTTVGQSAAGDASLNLSLANVRTTGSITITKEDSETGAIAQGDATLSGAVYGLYARSNIVHPDGHTGILYTAGSLVATFPPTDANRQARLDNLYLGNYYVKEITPSTGYLLDTKEYDVAVTYEGQDVPNVVRTSTVTEDVIKGNIRLVKHLQEKDPSAASRPQVPEAGAEFDIILKSSGVTYAHIITDADGFAQANMLPYGNYIVRQTKGKEGYSFITDFEVFIRAHERTYSYILENLDYTSQLQVLKKDAETGELVKVAGAKFEIYNEAGKKIVQTVLYPTKYDISVFETDESGMLELPQWLGSGNYTLKEVQAPEGYILNPDPIPFKVFREYEEKDKWGDSVIRVVCEDVSVKGIIDVTKVAPVLTAYEDGKFIYTEERVRDVRFQIIAAEDIYRADRQTDAEGNLITLYKKGDIVETLVTDPLGEASSMELPLGKYKVKEIYVPGGIYLDQEEIEVELKYEDDRTEIVFSPADFYDRRQQIEVSVYKYDKLTDKAIGGVEVSLYANRDILDYYGNLLVQKGTLIRKGITDNAGRYVFSTDIPLNAYAREQEKTDSEDKDEEEPMYYLIESKFPDGYIPNDIVYYIDSRTPKMTVRNTSENVDISNDPLQAELEVDKSAPKFASPGGTLRFTVSKVTNQCMYEMDEFTLTDILPEHVKLSVLNTGTFKNPRSHVVSYSIWFKTNYDSEWRAWKTGIQSNEAQELKVADMGLGEDEYVTEFQYRFGTVPPFFEVDVNPYYDVVVDRDVDLNTVLVNHIKLTGNKFGKYLTSEDETETRLLYGKIRASINGKNGNGGWFVHTNGSPKTGDQGNLAGAVLVLIAGIMLIAASIKKRKGNKVRGMKVHIFILFTVVSAFAFSDHTYAADSTVVKENRYTTNSSDDLHADYDEKIIEDNTFYKLKKVEYEVIDKSQVIVDKSVLSDLMLDTDEYDPPEKITEDGLIYKLVDVKQIESETLDQEVSGFDDYEKKISETDVPQTKTLKVEDLRTGEEMEVECPLSGIEVLDGGTLIKDSIDVTFEGYSLGVFEWNGNYVRSDDEYPLKGYEKDLLKSVGLSPSIYSVSSITWKGEPYTDENGVDCRDAVAEIQHYGYLYRANYSSHIKYVKYEASYENAENDNFNYVIKATAVYEKVVPVTQAVFYAGIGILIFCILLVLIMYLVSRNKKEDGKSSEKEKGGNAL